MARKIASCLNKDLIRYYQSTVDVSLLNPILKDFLPPQLQDHCQASSFVKGVLIITTTNSGFAYQLNYLLPSLREKLRSEAKLYQLASIKVKIDTLPKPISSKDAPPSPPKAAKSLEEAIASLENTLSKKYR
jgi:hypothetical protein